ncbi:MAG: hypothetical protein IT181_07525, partial [Acidobacteria bacterium]|nr:hypothetical protein [Acidobacteriota bacterium]
MTFAGLVLGAAAVGWAHISMGGELAMFLQPEALVIVFGGTAAALLVSFPGGALKGALSGIHDLLTRRPVPLEAMVPAFITLARKAKKHGLAAVERDIDGTQDAFLARALSLSITGLPAQVVREAL